MWPFRSHRFNHFSLPEPTPKLLFFILFLQVAAWYPTIKSLCENIEVKTRVLYHDERLKKQRAYQVNQLNKAHFLQGTGLQAQLTQSGLDHDYHWQLFGISSLATWRSVLEKAQETAFLDIKRVGWMRQTSGLWQGELEFDVVSHQGNDFYQNCLPVDQKQPPQHTQWHLVSIVKHNKHASALLRFHQGTRWVTQGDWLPSGGMSVKAISAGKVSLLSDTGNLVELSLYQQGAHQQDGHQQGGSSG